MLGVVLVSFCCIMFLHLGLGETLSGILHFDFILFRCPKCLTFWSVLVYTLFFTNFSILESTAISFLMSYLSLWVDLGLSKIAYKYDYWYEKAGDKMDTAENKGDRARKDRGGSKATREEEKVKDRLLS